MKIGTRATGGIDRMKSTIGSTYRVPLRDAPMSVPAGIAMTTAMRKPMSRFRMLGTTWTGTSSKIQLTLNCSQITESGGKNGFVDSALAFHHHAMKAIGSHAPMRTARTQRQKRVIDRSRR